nr:Smr/MutS family protein [Roseovarius salinarum]
MGGRRLKPEEKALWRRVAETTDPIRRERVSERSRLEDRETSEASASPHHEKPAWEPRPFEIGQAANPTETTAAALRPSVRMDRKAFDRMRRGKLKPQARLDLHGMTLDRAHPALNGFIMRAHASGHRLVLVITGKGRSGIDAGPVPEQRGVLRRTVPRWLALPPLAQVVLQVTQAHARHGGEGAFYVYLRRQG